VAGKKERQRELARQRHARRQARRARRDRRTRQLTISLSAGFAVAAVIVGIIAATGGFSSSTAAASKPPPVRVVHCSYTSSPPAARTVTLPSTVVHVRVAAYTATIRTNRGAIVLRLLNSKAPCTVNSFVHLAEQNYFSNTHCHRLTTSSPLYVLQCGDPTGTGKGGPGYEFASENLAGATYTAGTVAMANTGQPNSNGSQFFLVYKNSTLAPSYTPFGTIVSGLNIIQNVAKAGSDNSNGPGDGHPKEKVEIESVTISKA
jgi:peptidyl-prolyl cis-trans isomerase B (cyclophilin B)